MDRVLLGMSGGVDSSVAAIMLMEQGYEVIGATMKLWDPEDENGQSKCCGDDSILDAKRVCDKRGISKMRNKQFHRRICKSKHTKPMYRM